MGAAGTAHVQTGWVGVPVTPGRARLTDTEDDQWGAIWARSGHSHQGGGGRGGRGWRGGGEVIYREVRYMESPDAVLSCCILNSFFVLMPDKAIKRDSSDW